VRKSDVIPQSRDTNVPTRYRFDLEDDRTVFRDEIGVETDDLDHAIAQAVSAIDELRFIGVTRTLYIGWHLVICDDSGTELRRVRL
jgi:hypothetical protein